MVGGGHQGRPVDCEMAKVRLWILGRFPVNWCFPESLFFFGGGTCGSVYMIEVIFAWYRFCFWFSIGQDAGFEVDFAIPILCGMTAIAVFSLEKIFSPERQQYLQKRYLQKKHSSVLWGFPRAFGSSLLRSRALTKDGRFRFGKDPLHLGLGAKSRRYQIPFTS